MSVTSNDAAAANARRYKEFGARVFAREAVTEDDFLEHFAIQDAGAVSGPAIGSIAPDFSAPDQTGAMRSLADLYGPNGLLLVFVRSVYWCPYCRNQLGDIVREYDAARSAGIEVAVVAPDQAARVAEFTESLKPRFPVLCDEAGEIVRSYGLTNPNIVGAPHMTSVDVPFPGHMLIAPDGHVVEKAFTGDLRHRASATLLVSRVTGATGGPAARMEHEAGAFGVALSTGDVYGGIDLGLRVDVEPAPGWHVYAPGCPSNYQALRIDVKGEIVDELEIDYPRAVVHRFEALDEEALAYSSAVAVQARVRIRWRPEVIWRSGDGPVPIPGLEGLARLRPDAGSYPIRVRIAYQACGEDSCLPPSSAEVELPLELHDDVPAASAIRPKRD